VSSSVSSVSLWFTHFFGLTTGVSGSLPHSDQLMNFFANWGLASCAGSTSKSARG
jgi:hypothetical protein